MKADYPTLILFSVLFLAAANCVRAQSEPSSPAELEAFLLRAEKAMAQYSETFKNLSAEEIKIFQDFDQTGNVKEIRRIKSIFVVYQSPKGNINEFRNVVEFNGKNVARDEGELAEFFEKLAKADTPTEELKKIRKEGFGFDGRSTASDMTLWQESPFGRLKPFFEFEYAGKEQIQDRDVFVINYRQTKPTLLIKFNPTEEDLKKEPRGRQYHAPVSRQLSPTNALVSGKIWLDVETAQIWRNEFKFTLWPPQLSQPVTALELVFEYQPSKFQILVPKRFTFVFYKISGTGDKDLSVVKDRKMVFEYSNFSEFNSEVKNYSPVQKQ